MTYLILGIALVGVLTALTIVIASGLYVAMYMDYEKEMNDDC